ncbi:unnamed protein product [Porites lobata]|uniref:Uncharacterized protein n=1 Tax=Porites lobata TaxID=104759 RepID=A0ABN8PF87_9CNID|nr:unnamed protein product [Porites lobata]
MLHNSCKHDYQEKLIVDLLALFGEDIDTKKPIQVTVITNLVGKLKGNVNHKYVPLIKMIAKLHKTRLGETNFDLMSVSIVFGLPCTTTCDNYMLKKKLQPGFNVDIIQQAASLYDGAPVIEASDEARALRYISFIFFFLRCFE